MGRYALRSACRDECSCAGVKHGKVEKKADQVVKNMKKKNIIASKDDKKEKDKDKKSVQNKQRRMTTVAAKTNTAKDVESTYTMETRSRRRTMMATKNDMNEEEEEEIVMKPKTNGRRKTIVPKRKSTVVKTNTVEEKKKIVKTKKDTVVQKKDAMEQENEAMNEKGDMVEEENIDWQNEDHTQSIIEDDVTMRAEEVTVELNDTTVVEEDIDRQTKNGNQSVLRGNGDVKTKKTEKRTTSPSLHSIDAPLQGKRRSVRKLERKLDLVLEATPVHRFAAPIKEKMNETRRGGEWDTTDEEMLNDTSQLPPFDLTYPIGDMNDDDSVNLTDILCDMTDYETIQLREKKAIEQLEDEIEEIEKHHINPRAIIDQLTAENLKLRRTIFELKNK